MYITKILISKKELIYLKERWLERQYLKTKEYILSGRYQHVNLKIREPKEKRVFYWRINQQYRAWARLEWDTLYVQKIDNHQN